jgi:hypothetical protein
MLELVFVRGYGGWSRLSAVVSNDSARRLVSPYRASSRILAEQG